MWRRLIVPQRSPAIRNDARKKRNRPLALPSDFRFTPTADKTNVFCVPSLSRISMEINDTGGTLSSRCSYIYKTLSAFQHHFSKVISSFAFGGRQPYQEKKKRVFTAHLMLGKTDCISLSCTAIGTVQTNHLPVSPSRGGTTLYFSPRCHVIKNKKTSENGFAVQ